MSDVHISKSIHAESMKPQTNEKHKAANLQHSPLPYIPHGMLHSSCWQLSQSFECMPGIVGPQHQTYKVSDSQALERWDEAKIEFLSMWGGRQSSPKCPYVKNSLLILSLCTNFQQHISVILIFHAFTASTEII